jgi:hypothetical protein
MHGCDDVRSTEQAGAASWRLSHHPPFTADARQQVLIGR